MIITNMETCSSGSPPSVMLSNFVGWLDKFPRSKSEDTQNRILKLLENAGHICNLDIESLLVGVDFDKSNLTEQKLESIISEIRAIAFLNDIGFKKIQPQARRSKQKRADLCAQYKDQRCVIEVACLTSVNSREKMKGIDAYCLDQAKFFTTLRTIAEDKKEQIDIDTSAQIRLLVFVINRSPERELYSLKDYSTVLVSFSTNLNWGSGYFFAVVTGSEDLIYPNLP